MRIDICGPALVRRVREMTDRKVAAIYRMLAIGRGAMRSAARLDRCPLRRDVDSAPANVLRSASSVRRAASSGQVGTSGRAQVARGNGSPRSDWSPRSVDRSARSLHMSPHSRHMSPYSLHIVRQPDAWTTKLSSASGNGVYRPIGFVRRHARATTRLPTMMGNPNATPTRGFLIPSGNQNGSGLDPATRIRRASAA